MSKAKVERTRYGPALVCLLLELTLASAASADVAPWTSQGPEGGEVQALAIDPDHPSTLYAGTFGGGVFKTLDGGQHWTPASAGLSNLDVSALLLDPAAPATIFAATEGDGVFRSTDGGQTWSPANVGLVSPYVNALAISASGLYAGTQNSSGGFGVYKSTDGGQTWIATNTDLPACSVASLAIDPSAPSTVYAGGSFCGGVFKSVDAGLSWTKASDTLLGQDIQALAIDPSAPSTLYAATFADTDGVFRSTDGGMHWAGPSLRNRSPQSLAVDPSHPTTLYAGTSMGVARTLDGGASWKDVGNLRFGVAALAVDPSSPSSVYAATSGGGVFKSTDGGSTWSAVNSGLIATEVTALKMGPSGTTLYAATGATLSKSDDGGETWATLDASGTLSPINALAMSPSSPATLYAATVSGLFRSHDAGVTWTAISSSIIPGAPELGVSSLAIHPSAPTTIYAGTYSTGVIESVDGGETWAAVGGTLPEEWNSVYGLAIDPSAPATLYALTNGGAFKSVDGGSTWTKSLTGRYVETLAFDPSSPSTLYAGSGGLFKSTDGGSNWAPLPTSPGNTRVRSILVDPRSSAVIYAVGMVADRSAGSGGGVFRTTDGGATWKALNEGLTTTDVGLVALDPSTPSRIFAGTDGGGVFRRDLGDPPLPCSPTAMRLCLVGNRYAAELSVPVAGRAAEPGAATSLGDRAGYFALPFATGNAELPEVIVKMLEDGVFGTAGAPIFYASLTTLPYVLTVTDTTTGEVVNYSSDPAAPLCGGTSLAFPNAAADASKRTAAAPGTPATTLTLLGGRFSVSLDARLPGTDRTIRGSIADSGDGFGLFSLPDVTGDVHLPEVAVKMIDGRALTGGFWFFRSGLTSLDYTLTVVDSVTGAVETYDGAAPFCGAANLHAFADTATPANLTGAWIGTVTFPSDCYARCARSQEVDATVSQSGDDVTVRFSTDCLGNVELRGVVDAGRFVGDFSPPSGTGLLGGPATSTGIHLEKNCDPWGYGDDHTMKIDLARPGAPAALPASPGAADYRTRFK